MSSETHHTLLVPALVLGLLIAVGSTAGGYFVGRGAERFKSSDRVVTVKGLVEREMKSDLAIWTLSFRRTGNSLGEIQGQILADRAAVVKFVSNKGFSAAEIEEAPTRVVDQFAREYGPNSQPASRYIVYGEVRVRSPNVDQVQKAVTGTDELIKAGVVLGGEQYGPANPRYLLTAFNDLRPQLIAEATKNARILAEQFAADSGNKVGSIRSANQGQIRILGSEGSEDENAERSILKKIRVVSTFEFQLVD